MTEINFAEYKIFDNVNGGYSNFIHILMEAIEKVMPVKNKKSQRNFQECFHSDISEKLIIWEKRFKKYKKLGFM